MSDVEIRNKAYLNWIRECNTFLSEDFIPFKINDTVLGLIHLNQLPVIKNHADIFLITDHNNQASVTFQSHLNTHELRTHAANQVAADWLESGVITSWVGEQYDVGAGFNHPSFFTIERAASSLLGIKKYGIHLNAWVEKQGEIYIWVARRSMDKATFPGKLDHLVAGGHSTGFSIEETMIKECEEEANISETLARQAKPVGLVSYIMDIGEKLQCDNLFIYDLQLPETFIPHNTDGEAEEFYLWPVEKVLDVVASTRDYKTNCNLVIIDFAMRHGYLKPDEPFYTDICMGLRNQ
jgi:8-oxo-dGTP pyrophosphatase MutT (NUDIX family)